MRTTPRPAPTLLWPPEAALPDRADAIARAGLEGHSALAVTALDLFALLYGREAGNLALKLMSAGGVFVGGGIAPKILAKLRDGRFMEGFVDKGRMGEPLAGHSRPRRAQRQDRAAGGRLLGDSVLAEQFPEPSANLLRLARLEAHRPKNHRPLVHIGRVGGDWRLTFL